MGNFNFDDILIGQPSGLHDATCEVLAKRVHMPYRDGYFIINCVQAGYLYNRLDMDMSLHQEKPWKLVSDFKLLIEDYDSRFYPSYDTTVLFSHITKSFLSTLELITKTYHGSPPARINRGAIRLLFNSQLCEYTLTEYFATLYKLVDLVDTAIANHEVSSDILTLKFQVVQFDKDKTSLPLEVQEWLKKNLNRRYTLESLISNICDFKAEYPHYFKTYRNTV